MPRTWWVGLRLRGSTDGDVLAPGCPVVAVCTRSQENRGRRDLGNTQEATGSGWRASPGAHLPRAGYFSWSTVAGTVLCGQHRSSRLSPGCISHPRDDR